jgi:hypothetical protein
VKPITLIIGIIIVALILATGCRFGTTKTNSQLANEYPALGWNAYTSHLLVYHALDKERVSNATHGELLITMNMTTGLPLSYCNGTLAKQFEYSHSSPPEGYQGGWSYTFVVECEDINTYWVLWYGDPGYGPLYGPFTKKTAR